jgi:hypothetical protein
MSDLPDSPAPADETPAQHIAAVQKQKNFYRRITSSMPLLVTVIVHVLLIGGAAAIVVQQAGGGKKKSFEASNLTENTNKQVEHRLQVARRGGASSASQSPVSANRIFSTSENALHMPAMPDLPSMGAGGFGGFSGMGSGVGMGAGSGMATSLGGGTGLGGRGFMSLSFLGTTSQNVSNVVFVVDVSTDVLDLRKGGFAAFQIVRDQIARLVARLPSSSRFGVVFFDYVAWGDDDGNIRPYADELRPATTENKKHFITWIAGVNKDPDNTGLASLPTVTKWEPTPVDNLDADYKPTMWVRAARAANQLQPDVVFVITGRTGFGSQLVDATTLATRKRESEERRARLTREGLVPEQVIAARNAALAKARAELDAVNRRRIAENKTPVVIADNGRFLDKDFNQALTRLGIRISFDKTGWSLADGTLITWGASGEFTDRTRGDQEDLETYLARVQSALVKERATLNLFYFVGADQKTEKEAESLTRLSRRNGGTFQLMTASRLEEIKARDDAQK